MEKEEMQIKLSRMAEGGFGDQEVLNYPGHSLVLFWMGSWKFEGRYYYELTLDPNKFYMIGCDEEDTTNLLRYRMHFDGSIITEVQGVMERVYNKLSPEMSPDISYYSQDEYPHRDFALTCGIRSSFCFPFFEIDSDDPGGGIVEIVSTRNQDVGVVMKFCEAFQVCHSIHFLSLGSLEATSFRQLQQVMEQLDSRTMLCIRDSLYRLAEQRHHNNVGLGGDKDAKTFMDDGTNKSSGYNDPIIDRSVAHLLFHRPPLPLRSQSFGREYEIPELDRLLEGVCQKFHLPLTQYYCIDDVITLVHQFSYRDYENLAPWCQLKHACLHKRFGEGEGPLGNSCKLREAFFCRDITALSITQYPFAHYARNCGSIACFTLYLGIIFPIDEEIDEEIHEEMDEECVLEFFLPCQEMDNDYTQTLFNFIWATLKKCPLNFKLGSGEQLGQVLSVKVINSSTQTEPESFQVGQLQSSFPHHEGSGYSRTLKLFENGPAQRSNSNSYEEAATGEMSKRVLNEASQPGRSGTVEESTIEEAPYATSYVDVGCATSNVDIRNALTTASQLSRFQTKKTLCQQEEETMFLENEGDTSQQLPRISKPLYEDGTEQDEQVLEIKKSTPNIYSYDEMSPAATSKRTPEYIEQIISLDELDEELPIKCNEPQSLTSQPKRSEENFGDEGYAVASERVDNLVEVSPDEVVEYAATNASKRLKKSKMPCTAENIRKHFGRPLKDAAESFGVSVSTFKRRCRDVGISWWQPGKSKIIDGEPGKKPFSSGMPNLPNRPVVTNASQDFTMTVKVTCNTDNIRFELPSSSGIAELENSVIERLPLERKSFSLKYQDEENDWILIVCDKDVQECMKISRSLKRPTIKMLLGPPINNFAP